MTVVNRGRTRTFVMESFSRGETESAMKYIKPARERGTKMLKKDKELWMYLPAAERVQNLWAFVAPRYDGLRCQLRRHAQL